MCLELHVCIATVCSTEMSVMCRWHSIFSLVYLLIWLTAQSTGAVLGNGAITDETMKEKEVTLGMIPVSLR